MDSNENKKMEIEITRYKSIVKAFNNPSALAKLIIVIALIIILVFIGISIIALVMKSFYPYKVVNSNEYGATIIQNEETEVSYWLLNSADLWANSGISVKKGDVISVRASGAFHSSIHHLVDEAKKNKKEYSWLYPIGGPNSSESKESFRAEYRISGAYPLNTLLMQVIPIDVRLKKDDKWNPEAYPYIDGIGKEGEKPIKPDIYVIGAERDKITIRTDGVLHFTVNDIALTEDVIVKMKKQVDLQEEIDKKGKTYCIDKGSLKIGPYPKLEKKDTHALEALKGWGYKGNFDDSLSIRDEFTELDYYRSEGFVDAWFVDNAGSFLIVIERNKP